MKKLALAAVAFALSSGVALAADPMANLIGNTIVATGPAGTSKIMYKADKTFTGVNHVGVAMSGTWELTGGQLCTMPKSPPPPAGHEKSCGPVPDKKIGDSWKSPGPDGKDLTLTLVKGS